MDPSNALPVAVATSPYLVPVYIAYAVFALVGSFSGSALGSPPASRRSATMAVIPGRAQRVTNARRGLPQGAIIAGSEFKAEGGEHCPLVVTRRADMPGGE